MNLTTTQLREVKLLEGFTDAELHALVQGGEILTFEAHASIVIEGEPSGGFYLLLEGQAGIYKLNRASGDIHEVSQIRAGQSFGEMSLIDDAPRSATVQALTPCKAFHLPRPAFIAFLQQNQRMKCEFYERCVLDLSKRLRDLDDHYVTNQYQLWKVALKGEGKKAS